MTEGLLSHPDIGALQESLGVELLAYEQDTLYQLLRRLGDCDDSGDAFPGTVAALQDTARAADMEIFESGDNTVTIMLPPGKSGLGVALIIEGATYRTTDISEIGLHEGKEWQIVEVQEALDAFSHVLSDAHYAVLNDDIMSLGKKIGRRELSSDEIQIALGNYERNMRELIGVDENPKIDRLLGRAMWAFREAVDIDLDKVEQEVQPDPATVPTP